MKSVEIKQKIAEQRKLLADYTGENIEEVRKITNKIDILNAQLKEAEVEEEEERNFKSPETSIKKDKDELRNISRFLYKMYNGTLTSEDRALVTAEKVTALLPSTFIAQVKEIQKNLVDLSRYTQIIPVNTKTGVMPFSVVGGDDCLDVLDRTNKDGAKEADVDMMNTLNWVLKSYADFTAIDSEITEDDIYNLLTSKVLEDFARRSANTRTKNVFKILDENKTAFETGADESLLDALDRAIAKTDKMQKNGLVIMMDLDTYAYIDSLKNSIGERLDLLKDDKYLGKYPVEQVKDSIFSTKTKKYGVLIANVYDSVVMFQKKGLTIDIKKDALFAEYKDVIRVAERYDMQKADTTTIKFIEADK